MTSQQFLTWLLMSPPGRSRNHSTDLLLDAVPGKIIQPFKTASETLAGLSHNSIPTASGKIRRGFDDARTKLAQRAAHIS